METLKQKARIYLGHAFKAGYNGTPERFMDDLVQDLVNELSDHLLNSLPGERNGLNEEWCLGYNNMREEIITLITNAKK